MMKCSIFDMPQVDAIVIGQNLRRLRLSNHYSVRDIQDFFNFENPQAVYGWENGKYIPKLDNLYALSRLYGVSVDSILMDYSTIDNSNAGNTNSRGISAIAAASAARPQGSYNI